MSAGLKFPKNSLPLCAAKVHFQAIENDDGSFREPLGNEVISKRSDTFLFGKVVVLPNTGQVAIQFDGSAKKNLIYNVDFKENTYGDIRDTITYLRSFLPRTDPSGTNTWTVEQRLAMATMVVTAKCWYFELHEHFFWLLKLAIVRFGLG